GANALLADLAGPDVAVPVAVRAEAGDRVVAVDDLDAAQADDPVELVEGGRDGGRGALVVTRRKGVAGVKAHAHALVVQPSEHLGDLLEAGADAAAEPGVVLDEQPCVLGIRTLEHALDVIEDRREPGLEPGAL